MLWRGAFAGTERKGVYVMEGIVSRSAVLEASWVV